MDHQNRPQALSGNKRKKGLPNYVPLSFSSLAYGIGKGVLMRMVAGELGCALFGLNEPTKAVEPSFE